MDFRYNILQPPFSLKDFQGFQCSAMFEVAEGQPCLSRLTKLSVIPVPMLNISAFSPAFLLVDNQLHPYTSMSPGISHIDPVAVQTSLWFS